VLAKEKHEIELQQLIDMEEKQKELHIQLKSEVLKTKVATQYCLICLCKILCVALEMLARLVLTRLNCKAALAL